MKPLSWQLCSTVNPLITDRGTMQWIKPRVTFEKFVARYTHQIALWLLGKQGQDLTLCCKSLMVLFHLRLLLWSLLSKHWERFKGIWQTSHLHHLTKFSLIHVNDFVYSLRNLKKLQLESGVCHNFETWFDLSLLLVISEWFYLTVI